MVAERAGDLDDIHAAGELEARVGVPEGVERCLRRAGFLHERLDHPAAQVVGVERCAVAVHEDERLGHVREVGTEAVDDLGPPFLVAQPYAAPFASRGVSGLEAR